MTIKTEAVQLADNPAAFFDHSLTQMQSIDRKRLQALQLEAVKYRFGQLYHQLPKLTQLAEQQGLTEVDDIDDINRLAPLLFEHTMYKSYRQSLLEKHDFAKLNHWLDGLTTHDLSAYDVAGCDSIDAWLALMDEKSPLLIGYTSGTSGKFSLLPISKTEYRKWGQAFRVLVLQRFGEARGKVKHLHAVYPGYRAGSSTQLRANAAVIEHIVGDESRFHAAYPGSMSADLHYLLTRVKVDTGYRYHSSTSPELLKMLERHEIQEQRKPAHLKAFFTRKSKELRGERVLIQATSNLLYEMADAGLRQGVSAVFDPSSIIVTGGGAKGTVLPDDWRDRVTEFAGTDHLQLFYGMSEILGAHGMCEYGHYHVCPWIVPFVIDPNSGEALPRRGVVSGRAAFFDLLADSHWGGLRTGDKITLDWDGFCECGRQTQRIIGGITRYAEEEGGTDKINCGA